MDRLALAALLLVAVVGCRSVANESMHSASAPGIEFPYRGDPHTFGGIQEGTGGMVAATSQSMESAAHTQPKAERIAGPGGFTSMSGHQVSPAKGNDRIGDFQPLPHGSKGQAGRAEGAHAAPAGH